MFFFPILLIIHLLVAFFLYKKGFFKTKKQLVLANFIIFIIYIAVLYFFSFGINEFGIINCVGN